jgi:tetratricopeptide (TPR) repeat protein
MSVSAPASVASAVPAAARRAETPSRNLQYVAALGLLGLVALAVIFWLPRWVDRGVERDPVPESEMVAEELPGVAEERGTSRADVETVLAKVLSAREGLEGQAVDRWASDRFAEAKQLESAGDTALIEAAHDTARTRYAEALELLEELSSESGSVLASSLESGLAAIEAGDSQRATEQFALALAIDPGNKQASEGARRAETLAEVLDYMSSGERLEAAGDTAAAADAYAKALALDSQWAPARVALDRAKAHRAVAEYEQNLSVGLVALARGDLASARSHLERARELQPNSPEIADGLRQLRQAETSRTITSRRRRAEDAERAEKWDEAAAHYQAILNAQGNLAFAEEGLSRSRDLSRISEGIDALLADPRQLFRPDTLEGARKLMADGQRVAEGKPELAGQVRNLGIAIRLASTPIPVEFRSDRETEVVIRKVGTLGNFDRLEVPLKPGRYVVIGRRNGFRDVRREISVNPGAQPPVVDVRCTDEI